MKTPKAPAAPDPYATAQAQTQSNQQTANYQSGLNMVNQVTPYGNLTYSGSNNGQPGSATATQTLSPMQQTLLDQSQQADFKQNQIGLNQLDKVGGILSNPVNLNNEATEARLNDLGRKRLDPQFKQQQDDLEQSLINRGIQPGSAAYESMHRAQYEKENDAYNSLLLNGRSQAVQEALTERNQPLNEITGLLNGQQISLPQFTNTPQTNVAGTDIAGIVANNYNQQMQAYQNKVNQQNAAMGGLFGLAGTLGSAGIKYSDERLKEDIEPVGTYRGHKIYEYKYKGLLGLGAARQVGVMAQEVEKKKPDAVMDVGGFKAVDYSKL